MKTQRLYHEDGDCRTFKAAVLSCTPGAHDTFEVVLDRTAFYPTGGGQPHDTGALGAFTVLDVLERGDEVVHIVNGEVGETETVGEVDWDRRLDHRQQHTGQHILSRALEVVADASTVGFHLGEQRCSIDVDHSTLDEFILAEAEHMANRVVLEDLPVEVQLHDSPDTVPANIRNDLPGDRPIRLIQIGKFDTNPCCGTHCSRSGQVGPIKVLRVERRKGGLRLEFACGERALKDYSRKHDVLREIALELTTEEYEAANRVKAQRAAAKEDRSRLERLERELMDLTAKSWSTEATDGLVVERLEARREPWLTPLVAKLNQFGVPRVLLSSLDGETAKVSLGLTGDPHAGELLKEALEKLGGRGGGSSDVARGQIPSNQVGALEAWIKTL